MTFTPHPKSAPKAKKPGAMRSAPKSKPPTTTEEAVLRAKSGKLTKEELKAAIATKEAKAKPQAARKKATPPKPAPKDGVTKSELILGMLKKPGGASSKEIEAATGWAPHSVRGFLGTLRKNGVTVVSTKFGKGEPTVYSIEAAGPEAAPAPEAPAQAQEPGDVV